jgi:histone arginine demethylase JMJD6
MLESSRRVPIERTRALAPQDFLDRYLTGTGSPVIVTDALDSWRAKTAWNFEMFKSRYGSENVVASVWSNDSFRKVIKFCDYIDYLDAPPGKSPGFWIDSVTKFPVEGPTDLANKPLYLTSWRGFITHRELLDDVQLSPSFVEDWFPLLPKGFRSALDNATRYYSAGILIGPPGSQAILHQDYLHSHAYLAQIRGRKRCLLFSPEDSANLYAGKVDPDQPDMEKFPLFRNATAFECILEPGELLFIPCTWWHHVVAIEKSITVNYNFFNRVNFRAYFTDLLRQLPAFVDGLEGSPAAKESLHIAWISKGFEFPRH